MESTLKPKNQTAIQKESEPTILPLHEPFHYDLVVIKWIDASGKSGWKAETELEEDQEVVIQIGFLVKTTRTQYIVAASYYKDDDESYHVGSWDRIPKGMVKKLTVLVPKNVHKSKRETKETS